MGPGVGEQKRELFLPGDLRGHIARRVRHAGRKYVETKNPLPTQWKVMLRWIPSTLRVPSDLRFATRPCSFLVVECMSRK
ncbi:MAG: hypothetical protein JWO86_34 [Myxococcaceae bacterium]|nr:hypothetical protein [Myxococcaceae bacterium]MEA2750241.1 hypothetical protein [Myxococcales bacterium]